MTVHVTIGCGADLDGFRNGVRRLIADNVLPRDVVWSTRNTPDLFPKSELVSGTPVGIPRKAAALIEAAVCHVDPGRYALMYELLWRLRNGEKQLLEIHSDKLVHRLHLMEKAVRRDIHKMHAFLRFRKVETADEEKFVAWFEPQNYILEAAAPFFISRFRSMDWSILTPIGSLHWDRKNLQIGLPGTRRGAPEGDCFEQGWRAYYESTFNPARVNPEMMRSEMPRRYWHNMPETAAIRGLMRQATNRVAGMMARDATPMEKRDPVKAVAAMADQEPRTLEELNRLIARSEPFVEGGKRAVCGEGPVGAAIAFVGEQPGDQEDLQGRPFVGPAGQLLDRALAEAGIERGRTYLTNAVKHFKFKPRGKRRIHRNPTTGEIKHYRWWLMKELDLVAPSLVVALGGSAALALKGSAVSVTRERGGCSFGERRGYITVHPSYLLRLPDEAARNEAYRTFVADLIKIRQEAARFPGGSVAATIALSSYR